MTAWSGGRTTPLIPPRVEYEISDLGRSLAPLFASLARWSGAHLDQVEQARRDYDTLGRPSSS